MDTPEGYSPIIHQKCGKVAYYIKKEYVAKDPAIFLTAKGTAPVPEDRARCGSCGEEMALAEFLPHIMRRLP